MKKLLSKIQSYLSLTFQVRALKQDVKRLNAELLTACRQREAARHIANIDEGTARAMLMHLVVSQESVRGRTGFGVTAFIPDAVVKKLEGECKEDRGNFLATVGDVLLERAMQGMFRINSRGHVTATIFGSLADVAAGKPPVGAMFDGPHGYEIEAARRSKQLAKPEVKQLQ